MPNYGRFKKLLFMVYLLFFYFLNLFCIIAWPRLTNFHVQNLPQKKTPNGFGGPRGRCVLSHGHGAYHSPQPNKRSVQFATSGVRQVPWRQVGSMGTDIANQI